MSSFCTFFSFVIFCFRDLSWNCFIKFMACRVSTFSTFSVLTSGFGTRRGGALGINLYFLWASCGGLDSIYLRIQLIKLGVWRQVCWLKDDCLNVGPSVLLRPVQPLQGKEGCCWLACSKWLGNCNDWSRTPAASCSPCREENTATAGAMGKRYGKRDDWTSCWCRDETGRTTGLLLRLVPASSG